MKGRRVFVDASALVAMLLDEPEAGRIGSALDAADQPFTSPLAVFEAVMAVSRVTHAETNVAARIVKASLTRLDIEVRPVDERVGDLAVEAHERYGRGRGHPAKL